MHGGMLSEGRGATLVELVVGMVIISIALVTVLSLTSSSIERSVDPMIQEQANAVAQAYLEEITQKAFCDPDFSDDCPMDCVASACNNCTAAEPGGRPVFDDVCDFDGRTDNPPQDITGNPIPGLGLYSVDVQVVDDAAADLNGLAGNNGQVVRIDVTVTHPQMESAVTASGFRANF